MVEVGAEIFDSLEPDRDPQQSWVRTGLGGYRPVGQRSWMLDQGFGATERNRMGDELAGIGHRGRGRIAADHLECHHRAGAGHLTAHDVVRVAPGQPGKVHGVHRRVGGEPLGNLLGACLLSAHPHRQRLQPAVQQVACERMENAAGDGSHLSYPRGPFRTRGDNAGHHISMAADELGGAV